MPIKLFFQSKKNKKKSQMAVFKEKKNVVIYIYKALCE